MYLTATNNLEWHWRNYQLSADKHANGDRIGMMSFCHCQRSHCTFAQREELKRTYMGRPSGCSLPLPSWLHEQVAWVQPKMDQIGLKMDNNLIFKCWRTRTGGRGGAILRNATRPVTFTRLVNLVLTLPPWGLSVEPECVTTLAPVATTSEPCQSPLLVSHSLIWKVES